MTATAEPQDWFTANVPGTARLQQQFVFFKNISISEPYYLLNSSMVVLFKYILLKTCCVLTFECQTRQKQDTIGDVLFLYYFIRFRECWEQKYSRTRLAVCNTDCYPLKVNNRKQICKATQESSCLKLTKISVRSSVCVTVSCCFCIINKTTERHDFFAVMYPLLSVFSNKIKRLKRNLSASVL